tara:strand:- start:490 stop:636 length:147 start_codon:yes stop_codon:yes gene_type:complete
VHKRIEELLSKMRQEHDNAIVIAHKTKGAIEILESLLAEKEQDESNTT